MTTGCTKDDAGVMTMDGNGDLALGPHEYGYDNDMRAARRYERQLSTLGSLSRCFVQREGAGYRKELFTCFA